MKTVKNCDLIKRTNNESSHVTDMKRMLCKLGNKLNFSVDIEEAPESELGDLITRHDVIWYKQRPDWYDKLNSFLTDESKEDSKHLTEKYEKHLLDKQRINRMIYVAFEIEGSDCLTKSMKGCISNLSKYPYGIIIVKKDPDRRRFEKVLLEFQKIHGPNNVIIVSYNDMQNLARLYP